MCPINYDDDLLWAVYDHFCNQGITVTVGDFNGALGYLGGDRISSEPNDKGRLILEFLNFFNLKAVNFDSVCTGPTDTFFSFDGRFSSAIDLIVVPRALIPYFNWAYVFQKEAENLSDHVPVTVSIKLHVVQQNIDQDADLPSRKHISWQKYRMQQISYLFTLPLSDAPKNFNCCDDLDTCFQQLSDIMLWNVLKEQFCLVLTTRFPSESTGNLHTQTNT